MRATQRIKLGQWGEEIATEYLRNQGYVILGNNLRTEYGEIDILARQADTLVFVEVKTRSTASLGLPEISITPNKFAHMVMSAQSYLIEHSEHTQSWRIDVISVLCQQPGNPPEITHFENVNEVR